MSAHFNNNTGAVLQAYNDKSAKGLRGMANNTLRVANLTAPFRSRGSLKSRNIQVQPIGENAIRLTWPEAWSQYQNRGARADGSHRVRRYTTPGTGKGFVDKGVNDTRSKLGSFFV